LSDEYQLERGQRLLDEIERLRAERDALAAQVAETAVREVALADALETLLNEQNDVPLFTREKEWRTACQRGWAMIADPSPAAKRHLERVAALESDAAVGRAFLAVRQAQLDYHPNPMSPDPITPEAGERLKAAQDALEEAIRAHA
jgi:cell fate (sporulation/competence/biofilm development) regulator YlbF (YheA/YmcA/DUF963 family)